MSAKIGLEIHVGLNTKSKLFCGCATSDAQANTHVCPICLGHPGARITVNKQAVMQTIALALTLGCTPAKQLIFSRKTYFYPDMPRNYQITQYEHPIGEGGHLEIEGKRIGITRVHLEEDPAAITYDGAITDATKSLIDYNRAGSPLVEIVTEPDFTKPADVRVFMKKLASILAYLGVRDASGTIKADANISIEETGYTRVEIKNITGYKAIEQAIKTELVRQKLMHKRGKPIVQETRGWDGTKTYLLRTKEQEADYGYITEPNIPLIAITEQHVSAAESTIPELPEQKVERYTALGVDKQDAIVVAGDPDVARFYEEVVEVCEPVQAAKWVRRELLRVLNYTEKTVGTTPIKPEHVVDILTLLKESTITERTAQKLMEELSLDAFDVGERVEQEGLGAVQDDNAVENWCAQAIKEHPQAVADYNAGEEKSLHFLVGQVMRLSKGQADPHVIRTLLQKLIN